MRTMLILLASLAMSFAFAGHGEGHMPDGYAGFDVAQLADGETRFFGTGANVITASRRGDEVKLERSGDKPIEMTCNLSTDNCQVLTSVNDPAARPMIMLSREVNHSCEGDDCEGQLDTVDLSLLPEGAEGKIVIKKEIKTCNEDESDCEVSVDTIIKDLQDGNHNIWIADDGSEIALPHGAKLGFIGGDAKSDVLMFHAGGENAEKFNLAELADGETKTFGQADSLVTATRTGDIVGINRVGDEGEVINLDCNINQDSCHVITDVNNPDAKVMLMIAKTSACVGEEGECEDHEAILLGNLPKGAQARSLIKTKTMVCDDEEGTNCREEIKIIHAGGGKGDLVVIGDDESGGKRKVRIRQKKN